MLNKTNIFNNSFFAALRLCVFALIIFVGFGLIFALSNFVQERRVVLPESYHDEDLSLQGSRLKGWALGAEGLLADWYWMWSLQYIGDKVIKSEAEFIDLEDLRPLNPRLLHPMLESATDLDPKFMAAYSYGAIVLPAIDPAKAIELTEKGIRDNPDSWRLYQYLGFIYWRLKDYDRAADIYKQGSEVEGAPLFMKQMSAAMLTQGGSRDTARAIYRQMLEESEDQQSRNNAELRLMQIDALDELDAINAALSRLKEQNGRCPARLTEIVPLLRNVTLPGDRDFSIDRTGELVDPTGKPYQLEREECVALLSTDSRIPRSF